MQLVLERQGKTEEAAKAFDAFLTTEYAKTPEGHIIANDYLIVAKRWGEAADNYQSLSALLNDGEDSYTLDNIQSLVLKKYQANLLAGRRDSAVAISMQLCDSLAGAFKRAKEIDAAEQAVIVSKVEELGDQQVTAERRNQLQRIGIIGLLFLIILGYMLYRRYHHHQLKKAHEELQEDLGTIETVATGQLCYCNAGNNTPLLTDEEISLLPTDDTKPDGSQPGLVYLKSTNGLDGHVVFLLSLLSPLSNKGC